MSLLSNFLILFETDAAEAGDDVDRLSESLDKTEKSANKAVEGIDDASDSAGKMSVNFADAAKSAASFIAAFATLSALSSAITETAALDDRLSKLSQTYGYNIVQLDAWGAAISRNGGSAEQFAGEIVGIQSQLSNIQFGGGTELIKTLSMIGVSAFNSSGQVKSMFDLLTDTSDRFKSMSVQKSSAFGAMLGLSPGTILALQQGRYNLSELVKQQTELGGVTEETARASEAFNDSIDNLGRSTNSIFQNINAVVLPILTDFFNAITSITQWIRANGDFTIGFFIALGTAITAFLLPTILSLSALALPFVLIGAAVVAVGLIFATFYEDVKAYINGQESLIGDLAKRYGWFKTIVDGVINGVKSQIKTIVDVIDWLKLLILSPADAIKQLEEWFVGLGMRVNESIKSQFSELVTWLKELFSEWMTWLTDLLDFSFISDKIFDSIPMLKKAFTFGYDGAEQMMINTQAAELVLSQYAGNPLNANMPSIFNTSRNVYNKNSFQFSNQIKAGGVTADQVGAQFNDEFGRQMAAASGMLDDGIDH